MIIETILSTFSGAAAGGFVVLWSELKFRRAELRRSTKLRLMLTIQDDVDTLERMVLSEKQDSLARAFRIGRNSKSLGFHNIAEQVEEIAQEIEQRSEKKQLAKNINELGMLLNRELKSFLPPV